MAQRNDQDGNREPDKYDPGPASRETAADMCVMLLLVLAENRD